MNVLGHSRNDLTRRAHAAAAPHDTVHESVPPVQQGPTPFGLRFAVVPIHAGKHGKTYRTAEARQGLGWLICTLPAPFVTVDHGGQWWFLEAGANAQWGWLEHETGLPIADAIACQLIGESA
ncbi:MAG: hypothetical protein ACRDQ5_24610 [Sciscionella sp.]